MHINFDLKVLKTFVYNLENLQSKTCKKNIQISKTFQYFLMGHDARPVYKASNKKLH